MNKLKLLTICTLVSRVAFSQEWKPQAWPVRCTRRNICIMGGGGGPSWYGNGYVWGTCTVTGDAVTIEVLKGSLQLDKLIIGDKEKRLKNFRLASGKNRIIKLS